MSTVYPSQPLIGFDHMNALSNTTTLSYLTDPVKIENLIARIQALEAWTRLVSLSSATNDNKSISLPTPQNINHHFENQTKATAIVTTAEITAPASPLQIPAEPFHNAQHVKIVNEILDVIESYGISEKTDPDTPCEARDRFLPIVISYVEKEDPIRMVLPAFPFKSPNRIGKALGVFPDLGEELALAHLQGFCNTIAQIYQPGAEIHIASDGLVYNDLLSVSDKDVWSYGEGLRQMCSEKGHTSIKFMRLADLLRIPPQANKSTTSESCIASDEDRLHYLTHAPCFRRELVARYEPAGFDAKKAIKEDADTCLTYRGYLRFLKKDLEHATEIRHDADGKPLSAKKFDRAISEIATLMIARGAAFAAAVRATHGDYVRLSIHPTLAVTKFPVQLIPQKSGNFGMTPWHSSLAVGLDGSYTTGHAEDFRLTHDLIYRKGQPYYFREKSGLFNWGDLAVEFEHLYPCGLVIRPSEGQQLSVLSVPMDKVRELSLNLSPVVLRGFTDTLEDSVLIEKAHEIGNVLTGVSGIIQKCESTRQIVEASDNVTSNEMPLIQYNGMFKAIDLITGEVLNTNAPPRYQLFSAIATAPVGTRNTFFASSRLFWQNLKGQFTTEKLEAIRWSINAHGFEDTATRDFPLVVRHPVDGSPCLRWHEPSDETRITLLNNEDEAIIDVVNKLLYDYRVSLRFSWSVGDWLVNDNTSMLHTSTRYTGELKSIHFD